MHHAAIARQRKRNVKVGRTAHFPEMSCRKIETDARSLISDPLAACPLLHRS
jgi:hypothetical protein